MKLEFFEDGLDGGPMILFYEGEPTEVSRLRDAVRSLAHGDARQLTLNDMPFVLSIDECRLRATSAEKDLGVVARAPADFEWILDRESWLQVEELLEPFCQPKDGVSFQYLNPSRGPEVIYSTARAW